MQLSFPISLVVCEEFIVISCALITSGQGKAVHLVGYAFHYDFAGEEFIVIMCESLFKKECKAKTA